VRFEYEIQGALLRGRPGRGAPLNGRRAGARGRRDRERTRRHQAQLALTADAEGAGAHRAGRHLRSGLRRDFDIWVICEGLLFQKMTRRREWCICWP
jgi:hypothetical protein